MSDLTEAREAVLVAADKRSTALLDAIDALLSAHRSALAGETDVVEAAAKAMWLEQWAHSDEPPPENYEAVPIVKIYYEQMARAAAPILRAPLLAQLQEQEARIKSLEKELNRERGDAARLAFELAVETGAIDLERDAP